MTLEFIDIVWKWSTGVVFSPCNDVPHVAIRLVTTALLMILVGSTIHFRTEKQPPYTHLICPVRVISEFAPLDVSNVFPCSLLTTTSYRVPVPHRFSILYVWVLLLYGWRMLHKTPGCIFFQDYAKDIGLPRKKIWPWVIEYNMGRMISPHLFSHRIPFHVRIKYNGVVCNN